MCQRRQNSTTLVARYGDSKLNGRRIPKRRPRQVTGGHLLELRCGKDYFGDGFGDDEAWRKEAWETHRATVMERHREKFGLFTRPWAWWRFDAPKPRRRRTGPYAPGSSNWLSRGGLPSGADPEDYEAERAYLERLNLLTDAERDALSGTHQEPQRSSL